MCLCFIHTIILTWQPAITICMGTHSVCNSRRIGWQHSNATHCVKTPTKMPSQPKRTSSVIYASCIVLNYSCTLRVGAKETWLLRYERICFFYINRTDSRLAPSQWETSLQSNAVPHWLGANLESTLVIYIVSGYGCHQRKSPPWEDKPTNT